MTAYRVAACYTLYIAKDNSKVIFAGEDISYEIEIKDEVIKNVFIELSKGEVVQSDQRNRDILLTLKDKQLLSEDYDNPFEGSKVNNQVKLISSFSTKPVEIQSTMSQKTVLIVGLGGVGTVVLQQLIFYGVENFILVDFDKVSLSNLNRQFFYQVEDVGKLKLDCLTSKLKSNKKLSIVNIDLKINDENEIITALKTRNINGIDLIVSAADSPPIKIRKVLLKVAIKFQCSITFASVGIKYGSFGPLLINNQNIEKYIKKLDAQEKEFTDWSIKITPCSSAATNTLVSSVLSNEIFNLFTEREVLSLNKKVRINFHDYKFSILEKYD